MPVWACDVHHSKESGFKTACKAVFLIVTISLSTLLRVAQFIVNIYVRFFGGSKSIDHALYDTIDNPLYTLSTLLVPLGFGIYIYSPGLKSLKKAARAWNDCYRCYGHCQSSIKVNIINGEEFPSLESSIDRNVPSHTTYSSPYTNEFTDVTEIVSSQECKKMPTYGAIQS